MSSAQVGFGSSADLKAQIPRSTSVWGDLLLDFDADEECFLELGSESVFEDRGDMISVGLTLGA